MEGYDTSCTGSYTALPQFREYFGTFYPDINQWQIPTKWMSALGVAGTLGNFIGIVSTTWSLIGKSDHACLASGRVADRSIWLSQGTHGQLRLDHTLHCHQCLRPQSSHAIGRRFDARYSLWCILHSCKWLGLMVTDSARDVAMLLKSVPSSFAGTLPAGSTYAGSWGSSSVPELPIKSSMLRVSGDSGRGT